MAHIAVGTLAGQMKGSLIVVLGADEEESGNNSSFSTDEVGASIIIRCRERSINFNDISA